PADLLLLPPFPTRRSSDLSVRAASHTEMSVSVLPILFSAVVYGPLDAMIVGAFALSGDFRPPYVRWAVWTSQRALVAGTIGVVIDRKSTRLNSSHRTISYA